MVVAGGSHGGCGNPLIVLLLYFWKQKFVWIIMGVVEIEGAAARTPTKENRRQKSGGRKGEEKMNILLKK